MRQRQVWKYYCGFCKKSGCSKFHLAKHEERCTNNPNRVCGMCRVMENGQRPMAELIAVLPTVTEVWENASGYTLTPSADLDAALIKLREMASGCPACILAALRQAKIPVPMVTGFDYSQECAAVWKDINEEPSHEYLQ